MTHTGLVLSTQADNFHNDLWESYDLVILPEPDPEDTTNNMGLLGKMSWLGADIRWGTTGYQMGNYKGKVASLCIPDYRSTGATKVLKVHIMQVGRN